MTRDLSKAVNQRLIVCGAEPTSSAISGWVHPPWGAILRTNRLGRVFSEHCLSLEGQINNQSPGSFAMHTDTTTPPTFRCQRKVSFFRVILLFVTIRQSVIKFILLDITMARNFLINGEFLAPLEIIVSSFLLLDIYLFYFYSKERGD